MSDPANNDFWGMTGALLRKLDAQARPHPQKPAPAERAPAQSSPDKLPGAEPAPVSGNIASLHKLAVAYHTQGRFEEAERLYQEALAALIASGNSRNADSAQLLNNLGRLYYEQKRYREAEPLYTRSLAYVEESLGSDHPKIARRLANLADLYSAVGKPSEADACYRRAISIEEREFGPRHPTTVGRLRAYATMLRSLNRLAEAEAVEARAYFPRTASDRRSVRDRRFQEVPTALQGISVPDRRRPKDRRTGKSRRA